MNNYAFVDGTNLHLTYEHLDWRIDYRKLRVYLTEKYFITKAFYFLGRTYNNNYLSIDLEQDGYTVILKQVIYLPNKRPKANCDTELVLHAMIEKPNYDGAVIVSSDGDFSCLVEHLIGCNKLFRVLAPCLAGCSGFLKQAAGTKIDFLDNARNKLELK
jgi:uncharacterized LabA/DUF88 family protein